MRSSPSGFSNLVHSVVFDRKHWHNGQLLKPKVCFH